MLGYNTVTVERSHDNTDYMMISDCLHEAPRDGRLHSLVVAAPNFLNEHTHGKRFNGTAYYIGRWGAWNFYHNYIDTTFPIFTMFLAHQSLSRNNNCCLLIEDMSPRGPAVPAAEDLLTLVIPCPACVLHDGHIWADHVVVGFPFNVRPKHVDINNFPNTCGEFAIIPACGHLLREFHHHIKQQLNIRHTIRTVRNIVYIQRPANSREVSNIVELKAECVRRHCPITFVTAAGIGNGRAQVEYFSQVDVLIGVEGSAFLHAVHMPIGSTIILLHPMRELQQSVPFLTGSYILALPYRFYTSMAHYLRHREVNLALQHDNVDVTAFFDIIRTILNNVRFHQQTLDIAVLDKGTWGVLTLKRTV